MTTANNQANFRTARLNVGRELFGPDWDGSAAAYADLEAADQVRLNDELAWYIAREANQNSFSPEQRAAAEQIVQRPHFRTPLADTGFSFAEFGEAVVDNAAGIATNFAVNLSRAAAVATVILALIAVWKAGKDRK